jgi:hypothetical protein
MIMTVQDLIDELGRHDRNAKVGVDVSPDNAARVGDEAALIEVERVSREGGAWTTVEVKIVLAQ